MSTLSVWSFPATEGATSGLRLLERLQNRGRIRIGDSAIATWPAEDRRPTAYQVGTASGEALLSGAFWGLLFSVLFLAPLAGLTGPPWPHAGLRRIGLTDGWLELVRGRTVPGTSALFVLGADGDLDRIRDALPTDLPPACCPLGADEESALQHAFGTH